MIIQQININSIRNIKNIKIKLSPKTNVFVGLNGSGKTSLLESISFLTLGRSFRTNNLDKIISFDSTVAAVSAVFSDQASQQIKVSAAKHRHQEKIKQIGGSLAKTTEIARLAPTQIIHEGSSKLIFADSFERRKFLDWLIFYVKKEHQILWQEFNRALIQRNTLLKERKTGASRVLKELDKIFIELSEKIATVRQKTLDDFKEVWEQCFFELAFPSVIKPKVSLFHGWEKNLADSLALRYHLDIKQGFSNCGPHRADLIFTVENKLAKEVLSRGQGKSITLTLILARAIFLNKIQGRTNSSSVLLIDDLCSELDHVNGKKIIDFLFNSKNNLQVFITGIDQDSLLKLIPSKDGRWFFLENGKILE